jgi:hypothetical protein
LRLDQFYTDLATGAGAKSQVIMGMQGAIATGHRLPARFVQPTENQTMSLIRSIRLGVLASFAAMMMASAPAIAQQQQKPNIHLPKVDLQKLCKQNASAVRSAVTDVSKEYIDTCVADEQDARAEIDKGWATFPALARSTCIQPKEYFPGYVEWLSCLQMTRDVLKMRKENAPAASSQGPDARRQCPIVRITPDGSLISVDAC